MNIGRVRDKREALPHRDIENPGRWRHLRAPTRGVGRGHKVGVGHERPVRDLLSASIDNPHRPTDRGGGVGRGRRVGRGLGVTLGVGVGVTLGEGLVVGEEVAVGVTVGVGVTLGVIVGVGVTAGVGVTPGVGVDVGDTVGVGVGVDVPPGTAKAYTLLSPAT
jgi:hypothetical protein